VNAQKHQLVESAERRAADLRKLAKQAETIRWTPAAVMRENASLLLTLSQEIERLSAIIAWYWRSAGPYPPELDRRPSKAANSQPEPHK
jgi:hypothetical protein